MLLKKIKTDDDKIVYIILSLDEFWEKNLLAGLDYTLDAPSRLSNLNIINILSNLEINDKEYYPVCFKLKELKINSFIKIRNNSLITIDLLLPPESEIKKPKKNQYPYVIDVISQEQPIPDWHKKKAQKKTKNQYTVVIDVIF